jgi:RNA polymerase sigma-70 factor (ECF subfamily)
VVIELARTPLSQPASLASSVDFNQLYWANVQGVSRWVRRLGGLGIEVEDATQEVFLLAYRELRQLRAGTDARPWLFGIARNVVRHHQKARHRTRRLAVGLNTPNSPPDDPAAATIREVDGLYRLLDQLPEKYRVPVILFELEELPGEEIAMLLGIKLATCWTLIRRGRKKLEARAAALERAEVERMRRKRSLP